MARPLLCAKSFLFHCSPLLNRDHPQFPMAASQSQPPPSEWWNSSLLVPSLSKSPLYLVLLPPASICSGEQRCYHMLQLYHIFYIKKWPYLGKGDHLCCLLQASPPGVHCQGGRRLAHGRRFPFCVPSVWRALGFILCGRDWMSLPLWGDVTKWWEAALRANDCVGFTRITMDAYLGAQSHLSKGKCNLSA